MGALVRRAVDLEQLAAAANSAHADCLASLRKGLQCARAAGEALRLAKAQTPHGEWLPWVRENLHFTVRSGQRYMAIAQQWPRLQAPIAAGQVSTIEEADAYLAGRPARSQREQARSTRPAGRGGRPPASPTASASRPSYPAFCLAAAGVRDAVELLVEMVQSHPERRRVARELVQRLEPLLS
jgi:hypothetical protein